MTQKGIVLPAMPEISNFSKQSIFELYLHVGKCQINKYYKRIRVVGNLSTAPSEQTLTPATKMS